MIANFFQASCEEAGVTDCASVIMVRENLYGESRESVKGRAPTTFLKVPERGLELDENGRTHAAACSTLRGKTGLEARDNMMVYVESAQTRWRDGWSIGQHSLVKCRPSTSSNCLIYYIINITVITVVEVTLLDRQHRRPCVPLPSQSDSFHPSSSSQSRIFPSFLRTTNSKFVLASPPTVSILITLKGGIDLP